MKQLIIEDKIKHIESKDIEDEILDIGNNRNVFFGKLGVIEVEVIVTDPKGHQEFLKMPFVLTDNLDLSQKVN